MNQKGDVLLTLGEPGVKGHDNYHFDFPSDITFDPGGNLYVTDGGTTTPRPNNCRVMKYDSTGRFITKWGSIGQKIGQFDYAHSILADSKGDIFVCDGNQEANWTHIGRVYQICEARSGNYIITDVITATYQGWVERWKAPENE